jgi:peptidoglycan-N-acetylglucosamine deacetylase
MPIPVQSTFVPTFDFDAEEVWVGENPANASRPGVLSQGTYGAKVGIDLVLRLLSAKGILATFFVPGRVAERYPDQVHRILDDGHEVGVHGYTHRSPTDLTLEEESEELDRALSILRSLGADPVGYRSPSWDFSKHTLSLLSAAGLTYSSNMMDDIRPYRHQGCDILELPVQWILDDAPHFWFDDVANWSKKISTPSEVREIWEEEFLGIHELGGLTVLTMHPQIIGRPSRLRMLDAFLDFVKAQESARLCTAREAAAAVSLSTATGRLFRSRCATRRSNGTGGI